MASNNVRVALVVATLLLPALAFLTPAAAQVNTTYDLLVKEVSFQYPPTVGNTTKVYVVVANQGPSVSPGAAIVIRVFWNKSTADLVITNCTDDGSECWWLSQNDDNQNNNRAASEKTITSGLAQGAQTTITFDWTPNKLEPEAGPQRSSGKVIAHVYGPPTGQTPDQKPENNEYTQPVTVRNPSLQTENRWFPMFVGPPTAKPTNDCVGEPYPPNGPGAETKPCRYRPGQTLRFKLNVKNTGNIVDTFVPAVADLETNPPYDKFLNWNITFLPPRPTLAPGQETIMTMIVQTARTGVNVITNQSVNYFVNPNVRIFVNSSVNPTVTSENVTHFPTLNATHRFAMNITSRERAHVGNLTQDVKYNFTLNNNGNGCDSARLGINYRASSISRLWTPVFSGIGHAEVTVLANGHNVTNQWGDIGGSGENCPPAETSKQQNFTVVLHPPDRTLAGRHFFVVDVVSRGETGENADAADSFNFTLHVLQKFDLSESIERPNQRKTPGKTSSYELVVKNDGNGPDTVRLRLDTPGILPGWTARLSRDVVTIPAYQSVTVHLNVTPPAGELENKFLHAFVNGTSSGPVNLSESERPRVEFRTVTEVARGPTIVLTTPETSATTFVDAGANRTFAFRVRNDGNVVDNFTFEVDKPLGWTSTVSTEKIQLGPRQEATFSVTIRAPAGAKIGEGANAVVRVKSTVAPSEMATGTLTLRISGPDLYPSGLAASRPILFAGEPVNLTVSVGNKGNHDVPPEASPVVRFVYSSGGTERLIAERTITDMKAFSTRTITVPWDTTDLAGAGTILVRVDPTTKVTEIDESNNEASVAGESAFIRTFRIVLSDAAGLTGRAGERLRYEESPNAFVLENKGNRAEEVLAVLTSEQGWAKTGNALYAPTEIPDYVSDIYGLGGATGYALAPGAKVVVPFAVHIPAFPGASSDTATLKIVPTSRPSAAVTKTVTTTLIDKEAPVLLDVKVTPATANLGRPVNITAFVQDAVGLKSVKAYVKGEDNVTETLDLERGRDDVWYVQRDWPSVGTFTFYVEAIDNSKDANRASTQKNPTTLVVKPGSAPVITMVTATKTPIRAGTPLEFAIRDDLGVARASVIVGQAETPLPRTWRYDTSNLTEGSVTLTVRAENVYGVRSEQKFTVQVDNTPPELATLTLDPPRPRAGQEMTLRITTNATTEAVDVVVKRDGQVVETKAATRQGPGLFTLRYVPASGQYAFDVVATDEAGNENVAEGIVAFKAGGVFTPVPVTVAFLAVLVAVAILRRRR